MSRKCKLVGDKRQPSRRDKVTSTIKDVSKITMVKTIGLTRMEYRFEKINGKEVLKEIALIPRKSAVIKKHNIVREASEVEK